jgi:hypothetical protein
MSKKNRKFQGGNEVVDAGSMQDQLEKVMVTGFALDVEQAIEAISPTFVMAEFDQLCAMEEDLIALKERARQIIETFHTQRRLTISLYDEAIATRTRVKKERQEVVERHYALGLQSDAYLNVRALYLDLGKDPEPLKAQLRAHFEKQAAEKVFPGELEAAEKHLVDFKVAYAAARACSVSFVPQPAQEILDEATKLISDIADMRELIRVRLDGTDGVTKEEVWA